MNKGIPFTLALCCVWPLIVHFAIVYITRGISTRDWGNIRWPWGKDD